MSDHSLTRTLENGQAGTGQTPARAPLQDRKWGTILGGDNEKAPLPPAAHTRPRKRAQSIFFSISAASRSMAFDHTQTEGFKSRCSTA